MHVCVVLESHVLARLGGAEYQAHLLCEELARRSQVSVTYLARHTPRMAAGVPYRIRKIGGRAGHGIVAFDSIGLWRALRELRPDVIYQRMKQSYTGICSLYARHAGIPLVFHAAHDLDLESNWVRQVRWSRLPFDFIDERLGNFGVRHADGVIVQSRRQSRLLQRNFGREPTARIANFQPLPESLPAKRGTPVRVLWVANFKQSKRPELFVKLASHFANRSDLRFTMVGLLPANREYRALATRILRTPNLEYRGPLPLDAVHALMTEADIFVSTSRHEGFPNTFIQAWARGAVVVSQTVDVDGGLDDLGIGRRVDDFATLCAAVDSLARSPETRQAIATRAFAHVRQQHSLRNAARLADLVLGSPQAHTEAAREPIR